LGQQAAGVGTLRVQGLGRALQVSADIRQMSVASLKGASLKAMATLQDAAGPVRLMVRLRDGTNALLARAQARLTPLAIQLNALQGTWAGLDFNLRAPTSVTREQGRFQLARTMLSVSGGDLVVTARGDTKTLNAHLQLTKLPVAPLAAMLQVHHASGMLAASLNVALTPTSTLVHLQADGRNMVFASASKPIRPADFTFVSDWNGTALDTDGRITGFSSRPVTLNLHLPLVRRDGSFVPSLAASGAVRGALVIPDLDAGRLSALLPLAEESVTGIITADVRLVGDVIHPRLDGSLQIEHGSFSALRTGTRLTDLDAKVVTRPSGLADLTLNAKDGGSGTLKASGQISLESLLPGPSFPLTGDLKLQLNNAELVREDLIHGAATGTLEVKLPTKGPVTISGKLRTDTVHVDLGAAIPPAIPTIKVHYVGQRVGTKPLQEPALTQSAVPTVLGTARLDIGIAVPNRLYIAGRGLNSEWGGHLNIFGTVAHPAFRGQVQVINGTAEVIGKTFTLQSGLVHISNDLPGNAAVNVAAQYTSTNLAVTLTITGPATNPKINWSSVPALPKSEILSNLIFGAGTPQLSLGQAFQLAQMSGALSSLGVGGGDGGLLGFARNLTGLDVLNVSGPSSAQGTGASVTAGKYIGGRVYVGVTQGASTSASSAEVRVTVAPHVTVTGTVGANNANSLGVDWLWRY
ncbi:MAG: translocation/assembly module TamB domain-containing protein, partial [Alphaproteobacteria bacterium]|nr:translocation/assembly module TamB domain-containing protein [Alphaproteobacteria bacterium]